MLSPLMEVEYIKRQETTIRTWSTCLDYFLDKLRNKEPFAIMRYADGEKCVLDNTTLTNCDHWTFRSGCMLNKQLLNTLNMMNTNVYYGISGPSDSLEIYEYYYNTIPNKTNITYANIFVNQNYQKWVQFLKEFDTECVLISCNKPVSGKIAAVRVIEHIPISDKLVDEWDVRCEEYTATMKNLAARYNRTLFFLSAGPLSEVFIQTMYDINPNNTYLDVGSSFDEFTKGFITRPYQISNDSSSDVLDLTVPPIVSKVKQTHNAHCGNYYVPPCVKDGVCIDIGGNTGEFSLKNLDFFSKIHIYEPQSECYEIIQEKFSGISKITVFKEAVSGVSGKFVNLVSHRNLDSGSVCVDDKDVITVKEWTNRIVDENCTTVSLEDIIERVGGSVDYMKIDCETSEYNLLYGKDLSSIKYIGIELHWQMGEENFNKLIEHILKYFNNKTNCSLNYPVGDNIEVFFESKSL